MRACLIQFQTFAAQNAPDTGIDERIHRQAHAAVVETQRTLDELDKKIRRFLPDGQSTLRRATVRIAIRYAWNERALQAMMSRLRMRREAIGIIMGLWAT